MTNSVLVILPSPGWDFKQHTLCLTYVVKTRCTIGSGMSMKEYVGDNSN